MSPVLFLVLVRPLFSSVLLVSKSRACPVGVLHFLLFLFLPRLTLHTSMGPGRSSVLRIGSDPAEASSSGRTDGGYDDLAMVVHRAAPGEAHFPLDKGKGKLN